MKKNNYLFLLLLLLCAVSCNKGYRISGTSSVSVVDGKMIYLRSFEGGNWSTKDSASVVHGTFSMEGTVDSAQIVSIFMDGESFMPMVLEPGHIEMSITPAGFDVRGTELNDKLYDFIRRKGELDLQIQEASRIENRLILDGAPADEARAKAEEKAAEVTRQIQQLTKDFISANYQNILGPSVFLMVCGSSFPYPYLTTDLEELYESAPSSFQNHPEVKEYVSRARENMRLMKEQLQANEARFRAAQAADSLGGGGLVGGASPALALPSTEGAGLK
ncbi:MAG: DUF4369 domain-containing protein [Bacteroidaceae bacterium]|jgi:hypothetical protein